MFFCRSSIGVSLCVKKKKRQSDPGKLIFSVSSFKFMHLICEQSLFYKDKKSRCLQFLYP